MADKVSKGEATYRQGGATMRCEKCTMFNQPNSCDKVMGTISPIGMCDYFNERGGESPESEMDVVAE